MAWYDFFRLFSRAFQNDPLAQKDGRDFPNAGVSQPDAMPDVRAMADGTLGGRGSVRLRDTNEMVDLSTVTNRLHRYKEYERLRNMPEIEMAMTVFADEACLSGDTKIATPAYDGGFRTLEWLTENKKDERFLVYCWDFAKSDYTLGWAYNPRFVKEEETVKVMLDDGSHFIATLDHRILMKDQKWKAAGEIKEGDLLMPFYRVNPRVGEDQPKIKQFPRIFTNNKGWVNERQFVDEWKTGKDDPAYEKGNKFCRMIGEGMSARQIYKMIHTDYDTIKRHIERAGFSNPELKQLAKKEPTRRVIGTVANGVTKVYDLSVEKHENFCTNWGIAHNCQKDDDGRTFKIICKNQEVTEELEFLCFHRKMLNLDQKSLWNRAKQLFINGDDFWEIVIDPENPSRGVVNMVALPVDTMYRIETTKGRLVEFQQSKEGPDYDSLSRVEVTKASDLDLMQAKAIRFAPQQIVHTRIGDDRKTFYPYGVSLIEAARGPAHQLRLMEDAMIVYRLCITSYDKVAVRGGWKYMKDITIDDTIYVYNQETKNVEEGKVAWHGCVGKKQTYKVRSKHTSITGTSLHPIIVLDEQTGLVDYVKIKDLIPGRHAFVRPTLSEFEPKKINRYYKSVQTKLSQKQQHRYVNTIYADKKGLIEQSLRESSYDVNKKNIQKCWSFLVSKDGRSLPKNLGLKICEHFDLGNSVLKNKGEKMPERINLPAYVDEDFAMLFGFLLGDGCIKGSAKLLFAAGEHVQLNEKYSGLLKKYFGDCRFQQDKRIGEGLGNYCVNSATACEILENMGYKGKAHEKRIPNWVFLERPEIRKAFVKGFADTDGQKLGMSMKTWNTTIGLCNKELVEDIKQIWESIGLHASEIKKIDQAERWIKNTFVLADTRWEIYLSETEVPFYDPIVSIADDEVQDVYDLTVEHPTEHNFLCNGVPVSNTRAPERRVFYIDTQQYSGARAEAFVERMKDQFKKKKVPKQYTSEGASAVEERWHAPAADEDYWIPIRPNSNTRIETLPGAQNLGEIDDTVYFRNKLFVAMNFPKNYFNNEDTTATRVSLSAQDVKFARMIERLQSHIEDSLWELCDRHLKLRGYPEETYEDLEIKMTAPSDWRELTRSEVVTARIGNAGSLKGAQLMSDFDILTKWMKYPDDEAKLMLARLKIQKIEDLKLQIIAQNPQLLGVGLPSDDEQQVGAEAGLGQPMLGGDPNAPPPPNGMPPAPPGGAPPPPNGMPPAPPGGGISMAAEVPAMGGQPIPNPALDDIAKYDLDIKDYGSEQDEEEEDRSEI